MIHTIYRNEYYLDEHKTTFNIECDIENIDNFKKAIAYDNVTARLDGSRGNDTYISSNVLAVDVDNDEIQNPEDWITIDLFIEKYKEYRFYIATSKSHNIQKIRKPGRAVKNSDSPRPRFHAYFLLNEELTKATYPAGLQINGFFKIIDKRAVDKARFFYGNPSAEVYYNEGSGRDIIKDIKKVVVDIPKISTEKEDSILTEKSKKNILVFLNYLSKQGFFADYDVWLNLGNGLKTCGFEFQDWLDLSNPGEPERELQYKWNTLKVGQINLGTLVMWIRTLPGMSTWSPQVEKTIDAQNGNYNIVDINEFVAFLNQRWVKTVNEKGLIYKNIQSDREYKLEGIKNLYEEYIVEKDGKYYQAFDEWNNKTVVVEYVKKSGNKNGFHIEEGEKVYYTYDKNIKENYIPFLENKLIIDSFKERINSNYVIPSSYKNVNLNLDKGYKQGYCYLIAALSGVGKTWFLLNEAIRLATNLENTLSKNYKVLYVSTEMNQHKIFQRMTSIYYNTSDEFKAMALFQNDSKNKNVFENFGFFFADRGLDTDALYEQIKDYKYDILIIDYLDDFEPTRATDVEYKKHRIISEDFTELAVKLSVPVLTATQSNRNDSNEDGSIKKNRGYSGIGDGYQKTHKMAAVWNLVKVAPEIDENYRGLVSIKNRDVAITPDCHFELLDGGRLVEIQQAPAAVNNRPKKQNKGITDEDWRKTIEDS